MRPWAAGLWQVRHGPLTATVVVLVLVLTIAFPDIVVGVSVDSTLPARGVGTVEIFAVTLGVCLPAISLPGYDGREIFGGRPSRVVHLLYTMAVVAVPLVLVPVWGVRIRQVHPEADLPSVLGLAGNPFVFACLAMTICLLLGRGWSVLVTLAAFAALLVGQQTFPDSVLAQWFSSGRRWNTSWWLCAAAVALTVAVAWRTRSVPIPLRRG